MAAIAKKVGASQRGKTINERQRAALDRGRTWAKGLTSASSKTIARRSKMLSEKYKGRRNPEHSARMKALYEVRPDLHPNAILAKKTRGQGCTNIEREVGRLLRQLGVVADFNHRVGRKWVDFAVVSKHAAIEADGAYWHRCPVREAERDAYLAERGWRVLHLRERDILQRPDYCSRAIAEFLEGI